MSKRGHYLLKQRSDWQIRQRELGANDVTFPPASRDEPLVITRTPTAREGDVISSGVANIQGEPLRFNVSRPSKESYFIIWIQLSGAIEIVFWNGKKWVSGTEKAYVLCAAPTGEARFTIFPGELYRTVNYEVSWQTRREALEGVKLPAKYRALANVEFGEPWIPEVPAIPAIRRTALETMANPYTGAAGRLYASSKLLEMLSAVIALVDEAREPAAPRLLVVERRRVHTARDILAEQASNPPTLTELAGIVGMNYKKLNRLFREEFGMTAREFVMDWRLRQARAALEREGISVAEAASRFGYTHATHFAAAYRRKFGASPGTVKRPGK